MTSQKLPPGLELYEEYIDIETESWILAELSRALNARTENDFASNNFWSIFSPDFSNFSNLSAFCSRELKTFCQELADNFKKEQLTANVLNGCSVNGYDPGDGIKPHVDSLKHIGDSIITLNLNSGIVMEFGLGKEKIEIFYPPRSLVVMRGASRNDYTHAIPYRDYDIVGGTKVPRGRRFGILWKHYTQASESLPPDVKKKIASQPEILELEQQLRQSEESLEKSRQQLEESRQRLEESRQQLALVQKQACECSE